MLGQASDVADLARVVAAVTSPDAIYRQDAGKRRIVAYLYAVAGLDGGDGLDRRHRCTAVARPDLNRFLVHQPRDVERLVALARRTHKLCPLPLHHTVFEIKRRDPRRNYKRYVCDMIIGMYVRLSGSLAPALTAPKRIIDPRIRGSDLLNSLSRDTICHDSRFAKKKGRVMHARDGP